MVGYRQSSLEVWLQYSQTNRKTVGSIYLFRHHQVNSKAVFTFFFVSVQSIAGQSTGLYNLEGPKWDNVSNLAVSFGWTDMVAQSLSSFLQSNGISKKYTRELANAVTRLNHGQVSVVSFRLWA